jgi:cell division protein FtsL
MYEKLLKLKQEKQWLFWLLIIPFIFVAIVEFYNRYLVNSGKQAVKDAEKKDKKLAKKQHEAEAKANQHKKNADDIKKQIENIKVDEDWHKQ